MRVFRLWAVEVPTWPKSFTMCHYHELVKRLGSFGKMHLACGVDESYARVQARAPHGLRLETLNLIMGYDSERDSHLLLASLSCLSYPNWIDDQQLHYYVGECG